LPEARQRAAYLAQACGADQALRELVERLLAAHDEAGTFLETPATGAQGSLLAPGTAVSPDSAPAVCRRKEPGTGSGATSCSKPSGGGFGTVWMAEQEEPVRRRGGLKIIKLAWTTRQVVARFDAERQALALMDHPNIAHVFDGGATGTGRPYFVMELVRGCHHGLLRRPKTLHPRAAGAVHPGLPGRAARAQKGIIHRDLKPRTSW